MSGLIERRLASTTASPADWLEPADAVATVTNALDHVWTFGLDRFGYVTSQTEPHLFERDGNGVVVEMTLPDADAGQLIRNERRIVHGGENGATRWPGARTARRREIRRSGRHSAERWSSVICFGSPLPQLARNEERMVIYVVVYTSRGHE